MKFHRHARSNAIHALAAPISYLRDGFAGIAEAALMAFAGREEPVHLLSGLDTRQRFSGVAQAKTSKPCKINFDYKRKLAGPPFL
jgi:hypothetical protein